MQSVPLSLTQERLWLQWTLDAHSSLFNVGSAYQLCGTVDAARLAAAWTQVVARHASLRTVFAAGADGAGEQRLVDTTGELQVHALGAGPTPQALADWCQRAFDLTAAPAWRCGIWPQADGAVVCLVIHHILTDGWSQDLLLADWVQAYQRLDAGDPEPLAAPPLQYRDYAHWQRERQARGAYEASLAYWTGRLRGTAPLAVPVEHARGAQPGGRGAILEFDLSARATTALQRLAQTHGTTLYVVLLATYQLLLARWSGQDDICVGTSVANRGRAELEAVVGFFVNLLAMRGEVRGEQRFTQLLAQTHAHAVAAFSHQDIPYPQLLQSLDLGRPSVFQTTLVLQNTHTATRQLQGAGPVPAFHAEVLALPDEALHTQYELMVEWFPDGDSLHGVLTYDADLYTAATAQAWMTRYCHLLDAVAADPERPLHTYPLQLATDPVPAAVAWQRPSGEDALDAAWRQQVQATPDAIAVIADGQHWTYAQLDARANRLARHLQAHGVRRGDLVGLCLPRGNDAITALLATVLAGAAYVPLDPDQPAERLAEILHDAGLLHLVSDEAHLDALDPTTLFGLDLISLDGDPDWLTHSDQPLPPSLSGEDLAYLVYTSGSTGRAKGVAVPHRGVVRLVRDSDYHRGGPGRRLGHAATLAFDAATFEIWGALLTGAAVVVLSKHDLLDPDRLRAACRDHAIDTLFLTTALFNHCVEQLGEVIADLDTVLFGGEQVDPDAVRALLDRHGRVRVLHVYGPTENTTFSSWHPVDAVAPDAATVPIGRALSRSSCLVLDPYLNPVPAGVDGELYVGGAGLARGYWAQPATTAERFLPHPWQPGERLYRTGDLVRWNVHGQLEFVGRRDHQVKLRGYRIELGEVEVALLRHPQVHGTCTQVRELGGRRQLVAWCQVEGPLGRDELKRFVRQHLPEYMVPSVLVTLAQLPLNANGKIDRDRLPDPEADAEPDGAYTAPRDPREAAIAQVWASVLKRERVGIHDNFFELGGDSLLATGVITRMRAAGFTVSVPDLFQRPTVAELAALSPADEAFASVPQSDPYVPFELIAGEDIALRQTATDAYPLSRMQQEMLLQGCLYPASPVYHDVISYRLTLRFDEPALRQALTAVAARFEILRSKVHLSTVSEPLFVIDREASFNLHVTDLHGDEFDLAQWQDRESRCGFDFENELPWRVFVHRLDEREFVLSLSFHHVILDGWSESLLVTTLLDDYRSALGCTLAVADPTAASFGAHVRNEKQACTNPNHREFWTGYLDGAEVLALATATDASTTDAAARAPRRVDVPINHALLAALEQTAAAARANIKSVLLAAHGKVLSLLGGGADVVTGIVTNGRPETPDGDRLIGMYLNSQPLRLRLGHGSWLDLVAHAYQADTQLYAQRLFPLSEVTQATGANRWFDVLFNFTRFRPYLDGTARNDVVERSGVAFNTVALFADFDLGVKPVIRVTAHVGTLAERRLDAYVSLLQAVLARLAHAPAELHHSFQAVPVPATATATAAAPAPLPLLLEAQCRATPDAIAYRHDGQTLDYRTLVIRVERVAAALAVASGDRPAIGTGMCVVVCMRRTLDLPVAMLAVMRLGATCVPVDPDYPAERITLLVDDCNAALALVDAETRSLVGPSIARATLAEVETQAESGVLPLAIAPATIAYLIYTSGSTGMPKGVAIHHGALSSFLDWCGREFDREEAAVVLAGTSVCFDLSVFELFFPLTFGGQALIVPNVLALVSDHTLAPTLLNTVPSAARELAELGAIPASVRAINVAGEPLRGALVARLYERSGVRCVRNLYGPSETTTYSTFTRVPRHDGIEPTIGRAIDVCTVYLLDAHGNPVMDGATGEIYIGGPPVATGYWNRNAATAERFLPDPFSASAGTRMYRTGDLARCIDGELHFLGRADHQVKVRGYRIELGEIEQALLAQTVVHDAVVAAHESDTGARQVVAYACADATVTQAQLVEALSRRLPAYMVPTFMLLLPELPRTPNGKVDRSRLPAPDVAIGHDVPDVPTELHGTALTLAQAWSDTLGMPVRLSDNFFSLGGDSISSLRLVSAARRRGLDLVPRDAMEFPVLADQAVALDARAHATTTTPQATAADSDGTIPCSPMLAWLMEQDGWRHYHQHLALDVAAGVDAARLEAGVRAAWCRHAALRGQLCPDTGAARIQPPELAVPVDFGIVELTHLPPGEAAATRQARCDLALAALDPCNGRNLCALLFRDASATTLWLAAHHWVVDSVSWSVLIDDLDAWLDSDGPAEVAASGPGLAAWLNHLATLAASAEVIAELPMWKRQCVPTTAAELLACGATAADAGGEEHLVLPVATCARWAPLLAQRSDLRMQDLLLGAVVAAIADWQGNGAVGLVLESHGRPVLAEAPDVARTVGWCTATYPLRLELTEVDTGTAIAHAARALRTPRHQGLGYGLLRWLSPDHATRDALRTAGLPSISFNYLGRQQAAAGRRLLPAAEGLQLVHGAAMLPARTVAITLHFAAVELHCRIATGAGVANATRAALAARILAHLQAIADATITPVVEPERAWLLTPVQRGALFHYLADPHAGRYVIQAFHDLEGELDVARLRRAWQQCIDRHDALRAVFSIDGDGQATQRFLATYEPDWAELDWRGIPDPHARFQAWLHKDRARGFGELDTRPPLRLALVRLDEMHYRLTVSVHHAQVDGWSMTVLLQEVRACYDALAAEATPGLPEPAQFPAFLALRAQPPTPATLQYWRDYLDGYAEPVRLPQLAADSYDGALVEVDTTLTASECAAIDACARRHGVTVNQLMLGAWGLLLADYAGVSDLVLGTTVSGRDAGIAGIERMVGPLINTVPVRLRVDRRRGIGEWLQCLRRDQAQRSAHEAIGLGAIAAACGLPGETNLFDSLFVFENYPADNAAPSVGALRHGPLSSVERSDLPLVLLVVPGATLQYRVVGNDRRFDAAAVAQLSRHYRHLLIALDGCEALHEVRVMDCDEARGSLLIAPAADADTDSSIHHRVAHWARLTPDAPALQDERNTLSYAGLDALSDALAAELVRTGLVERERPVAIAMDAGVDAMVALLGVLKAGGAFLPLSPDEPPQRLTTILDACSPTALIVAPEHRQRFASDVPVVACNLAQLPRVPAPAVAFHSAQLAYLVFTSGSTGTPKGVGVPHASIMRSLAARTVVYGASLPRVMSLLAFGFDAAIGCGLWPLMEGGCLLMPGADDRMAPARLQALFEQWRPSQLCASVAHYQALLAAGLAAAGHAPSSTVVGGEACGAELAAQHAVAFPCTALSIEYGTTEVAVWSTAATHPDAGLGAPVPGAGLQVLDAQLHPVPPRVIGEAYLVGDWLARGYYADPVLTALRFVPDPWSPHPGARMYRSGDLMRRRADGSIAFAGRIGSQLKIRGYRVDAGEIATALRCAAGVQDVVVLPRGNTVVAYAVSPVSLDETILRGALATALPEYMIPARIHTLADLPLTSNGKVDPAALDHHLLPVTDSAGVQTDALQTQLSQCFGAVLGTPVGPDDNFFELGGDSIKALLIATRLRDAGLATEPGTILRLQTVRAVAAVLQVDDCAAQAASWPETEEPSAMQHWFFEQAHPQPQHWNMSVAVQLRDGVEAAHVEQALAQLVARHDALRTSFPLHDGVRRRRVATHAVLVLDVATSDADTAAGRDARIITAQAQLDLVQAPLASALLLPQRRELVLCLHHLVTDTTSLALLVSELDRLLDDACQDRQTAPSTAPSWARWIDGQLAWAATPAARAAAADWLQELDGAQAWPAPTASSNYAAQGRFRVEWPLPAGSRLAALPMAELEREILRAIANGVGRAAPDAPDALVVWREQQGRVWLQDPARESTALGWHTAMHPLRLQTRRPALPAIPEAHRAAQFMTLVYGLPEEALRAQLRQWRSDGISFSFFGDLAPTLGANAGWVRIAGVDHDPPGATAPTNRAPTRLQFNAWCAGDALVLSVLHCPQSLPRGTVEALLHAAADAWASALHDTAPATDEACLDTGDLDTILDLLHG